MSSAGATPAAKNSAFAEPLLRMEAIEKSFPGVKALQGVSFSVARGEVHGLVGENGAGKSTLMKVLAGAYHANGGRLELNGQEISAPTPAGMIERGVAVIYQEFAQAEHLSVAENIFMNRLPRNRLGRIDWKTAERDAEKAMSRLGFSIDPRRIVASLSVAQRQMVEIARAISRNAQLIVLDEPSAVLGDNELEKLFATIRSLQSEGVAFIYISHRLKEIFELCQRATVLRDGRMVSSRPIDEWTTDTLIQSMVGRPMGDYFPKRNAQPGNEALQAPADPNCCGRSWAVIPSMAANCASTGRSKISTRRGMPSNSASALRLKIARRKGSSFPSRLDSTSRSRNLDALAAG
jgi:ribose transport system ATP-binding protein